MKRISLLLLTLLMACAPTEDSPSIGADGGGGGGGGGGEGGGGGGDLVSYSSGSRIRARVHSTPDGATTLAGWRDTAMDVDCAFSNVGDGSMRCLPTWTPEVVSGSQGEPTWFADAQCQMPIARVREDKICTLGVPSFGSSDSFHTGCDPQLQRYWRLTPRSAPSLLYNWNGVDCYVNGNPTTGYAYYDIGDEVALSSFQEVTESLE